MPAPVLTVPDAGPTPVARAPFGFLTGLRPDFLSTPPFSTQNQNQNVVQAENRENSMLTFSGIGVQRKSTFFLPKEFPS